MSEAGRPLPNDLLRQARLRMPSPSGSGRSMSRQELADAVNTYLAGTDPSEATLDANHIGKLERGHHRWPSHLRRKAFRHVLRVAADGELGFYIIRGLRSYSVTTAGEWSSALAAATDTSGWEQIRGVSTTTAGVGSHLSDTTLLTGTVDVAAGDVDPALVPHWSGMLRVLAATHDLFGPHHLHDVVRGELGLIRRHRRAAASEVHDGLLDVECRWAEFASWTADNLGDQDAAAHWLRLALSLGQQADNPTMIAYVLMRQAQQAVDHRDPAGARALAEEAREQVRLSDRDRALCAIRYAQALALAGEARACSTPLNQAYRLVARADDTSDEGDPDTIGRHCVRPYVTAHEGYCKLSLGHHRAAVAVLEEVLVGWPPAYRQDEALTRAWLALAYAGAGRPAEAGTEGSRALAVTIETGSARAHRNLGRLDTRLAAHAGLSEADQFRRAHRALSGRPGRLQP